MTAETSNARGEWVLVPRNPTEAMIDSWRDAPDIWEDAYAAMLAAAPPPPADAEVWVFKGTDGAWRTFHNEQHRLDTIADGRWEVRKFTALSQQPEAQGGGEVAAWETEDGRVISARQKATALRDGGASASSVAPYTTPLYRTAPPSAPVEVDAPGSRSWMAEVCRAAALSLAAHGVRNDQLSKVADWIAQQPAAMDEGFVSRLAEALTDHDWDVDPDGDGSGIAQLRAAVVAAQHQEPTT